MGTSIYIKTLTDSFKAAANPNIAEGQKAYMRQQFEFFGLKAADRRQLQRPFLHKASLPPKAELYELVPALWAKPERDFQLFGQELVQKYLGQFDGTEIGLLEFMVQHKSWWDTVDFIAVNLMGPYFKKFPEQQKAFVSKCLASNQLWLQRSALLFQLKYKEELNTDLLASSVEALLGSNEFFINKAIGWILRQYSRTNPQWVHDFVQKTPLAPLSRKEATRLLSYP